MHPSHGARVVLELVAQSRDQIRYAVSLYTPVEMWQTSMSVRLATGRVRCGTWQGSEARPPSWLVLTARSFLRTQWRACQADASMGWPRRILRWRPAKTAAQGEAGEDASRGPRSDGPER
ncbi:MAG: hypothetical protein MJD61_02210 [Proteobacteria bacterium]|nr:hypothetical protein [Pseudomonadota bacterium]